MSQRFKLISCEVLARQVYFLAAISPHIIDIELVEMGLHAEPDRLREALQAHLDAVPEGRYDAILLGYGLCSNSIVGLVCPHTRMIVPRAHDCITLYLGSRERYGQEFRQEPGTYWYAPDYVERAIDYKGSVALGASQTQEAKETYEDYVRRFGRDNADYLMEVMGAWQEHYSRAAYITNGEMPLPDYCERVRQEAERRGWRYEELAGRLNLIRRLLDGEWDPTDYVTVEPGQVVAPTFDERVFEATDPTR